MLWKARFRSQPVADLAIVVGMDETDTKQAIKTIALELLVRHGYRGVSFGDISAELGTTRANIHYHFGSKQTLVDEVLRDYIRSTLDALRTIWSVGDLDIVGKFDAMIDYSRARFLHFNPAGSRGHPWSLIARLRQDADLLSPDGRQLLGQFSDDLSAIFTEALTVAHRSGELGPNTDPSDAALLLAAIADNAAPITLALGGFERLQQTYMSLRQMMI
jgi:AcrR family transcriptional regulator